jgi:hypothetical protein
VSTSSGLLFEACVSQHGSARVFQSLLVDIPIITLVGFKKIQAEMFGASFTSAYNGLQRSLR